MELESFTIFFGSGVVRPTVSSANTTSTTVIRIVFSENMSVTTAGWTFKANGTPLTLTSVSGSNTTWDFVVGTMSYGDVLTWSYDRSVGNTVSNPGGIELGSKVNQPVTNNIPSSAYNFYRSITIDKTKVPNTDQTDFPVLVEGTYTYLKYTGSGGDVENPFGYDINFFSDSGLTTFLSWEIESYDSATGAIIAWINVPTVSTSTNTVIYMAYGNAAITTFQGDVNGTWNSGYVGVYHLPDGTTLTALDSTVNANNGTIGGTGPDPATGYIDGGALGISGNSPTIDLGTGASLNLSGIVSLSAWVNFTNVGILQNVICKGGEDYRIRLNGQDISIGSYDGSDHGVTYSSSIATGAWHYISGGYDGTTWHLFYDGSSVGTSVDATGAIPSIYNTSLMSNNAANARFMEGYLDEPRISNVFRSADWWATEYNNQSSPSTFYTISSPL